MIISIKLTDPPTVSSIWVKFKGKETGKCQMYVTLDVTPILEIKTPEYTVFINSREGGMAESWYQELKQ